MTLGDPRKEKRYTLGEIAEALGLKATTVSARQKSRGIPVQPDYSYADAMRLARKTKGGGSRPRREAVNELKGRLKNDGYL